MWQCSETSHSVTCTYLDKKAISTSHWLLLSRKFYLPCLEMYQKLEVALASGYSTPSTNQSNWPFQGKQVQCCVCSMKNKQTRPKFRCFKKTCVILLIPDTVHPTAFPKGKIGTHKPKKKLCHSCTLLLEYKSLDEITKVKGDVDCRTGLMKHAETFLQHS